MYDVPLLRLAARQHWVVSHGDLVKLGFSPRMIESRIRAGALFGVHRGVYGVTGADRGFRFRAKAACLAAGWGALVSHETAAVVFDLRGIDTDEVHVTVAGRCAPRVAGVHAHRTQAFAPGDRAENDRIPVTSPARTLLDLAGRLDPVVLEGALDDVLVRRLARLGTVERRARGSRLVGARLLHELVEERKAGRAPAESVLEDELGALIRRHGLPEPVRQHRVDGGRIRLDCAYPDRRLDLEADGDRYHAGLLDQRRDAARDRRVEALGWTVRRFSTDDIRRRPGDVAAEIDRLLALTRPA